MSTSGLRYVVVTIAVALMVSGCGDTNETGISPQDPAMVEKGGEPYQSNCAQCHGEGLRGTDTGPSHLSRVYEPSHHGDGAFELAIRIGSPQHHWNFGNMEPVEGLSDDDIAAIIAFVREQQRLHGFEPYPPPD